MKTSAGILSYEIYNQEGKNELSISQQEHFTQLLKLKLRNSSPYHQILFDTAKTPHLTLKFKKGLLPKGFKSSNIKIKKYRLIKGNDLFSQSALEGYLFDKSKMEQEENFQVDVQKILDAIDASQATRSVENPITPFGIESLLTHFQKLKPEEKTTTYKWIGQLDQIQTDYKTALSDIRKLTLSNDVIKANPLFTSIIQETASVFEKLTALQQHSIDIEHSLETLAKQVQAQQKADIQSLEANFQKNYKQSTEHLINALKTNLKTIIVDALHGTKIKDITNLQQLTIDEDIIKKLEEKVFIQADVQNSDWLTTITTTTEEDSINFTCNKKIQLAPNEYLLMDLELVGALKGTAESVATELNYSNLVFQKNGVEDTAIKDKLSQSVLNLVNDGAFGIPPELELLVAEGKEILNNGQYSNTVKLNLINKGQDNIILSDASKISLSFYNQQENETVAYALQGKDDALESVQAMISNLNALDFLTKNQSIIKNHLDISLNNIKRLNLPFQDFRNIFYTNYSVSTKSNGDKTKLYTGVIGIKITSNQLAIYQPRPNVDNANVRDLETKPVASNQFAKKTASAFELVDEPMELRGTFLLNSSKILLPNNTSVQTSFSGLADKTTTFNLSKSSNTSTIQTTYSNQNSIRTTIAPNQSLELVLNGIKTQLPVGEANIKVSLLNIPNYKDAHLSTNLNRVTYLSSTKKGIFTTGNTNNNLQLIQDTVEIKSKNFAVYDNVYKVLPVGSVIMWYGSVDAIPGGWKICNGDYNTPDLRDRFVVGAGGQYKKDETGGQNKVTLSQNELPSHNHSGSTSSNGDHLHKIGYRGVRTGDDFKVYSNSYRDGSSSTYVETSGNHSHSFSTNNIGGNQSHENRPPYYALYYIIRVKQEEEITTTNYLKPDTFFQSPDSRYTFILQSDGNIVIYDGKFNMVNGDYKGNSPWNSGTYGKQISNLIIKNGDLVAFDKNNNRAWNLSSNSNYKINTKAQSVYWEGSALVLSDDKGNTIYTIWSA